MEANNLTEECMAEVRKAQDLAMRDYRVNTCSLIETRFVRFTIQGRPIAQPRLRHVTRGGMTRMYDPSYGAKRNIKEMLMMRNGKEDWFIHPHVTMTFYFQMPKSLSKKERLRYETEKVRHEVRPDADNCQKHVLDILTGLYYEDDKLCSLGPCYKYYSNNPRTEVTIEEAAF